MSPTRGAGVRAGGLEPLLEATLQVVLADGAGAVTVRRVAERAGVSPGTVTHHVASVDALLVAALEHACGGVIAEYERLALDLQDADLDAAGWAGAFAAALGHSLRVHPERHVACFELKLLALRRPELRETFDRVLLAYLRIGRIAARLLGAADPDAFATVLVATTTGLVLGELGAPDAGREGRLAAGLERALAGAVTPSAA